MMTEVALIAIISKSMMRYYYYQKDDKIASSKLCSKGSLISKFNVSVENQ